MAFWQAAYSSAAAPPGRAAAPAQPLSLVLRASGALTAEPGALVRLKIQVPAAAAALEAAVAAAAAAEEEEDADAAAERQSASAAAGLAHLHRVVLGVEAAAGEAADAGVIEVLHDMTLQLLCSRAMVAKAYKALIPHQERLAFVMGPAKECLVQKAVADGDLHEALQTAVIKTLTGSSSGVARDSSGSNAGPSDAGGGGGGGAQQAWMCLGRHKLASANLLATVPGEQRTVHTVELEAKLDSRTKRPLLIISAAGSSRFRLFSPAQALAAEATKLRPPLTTAGLSDAALLADPAKLAAAARQLDGRAVKLLPDESECFIKSLAPAPSDAGALAALRDYWLGAYGLLLPAGWPFLVGLAPRPEDEAALLQVPSCCVLTSLGLSALPGSRPGGAAFNAALAALTRDLQVGSVRLPQLWGSTGLRVELPTGGGGGTTGSAGRADALVHPSQLGGGGSSASASDTGGAEQLKPLAVRNSWTTAADLQKLQAQAPQHAAAGVAGGRGQQEQPAELLSSSAAALMGLAEAPEAEAAAGPGAGPGGPRQPALQQRSKERWSGLAAYLAAQRAEQEEQQRQRLLDAVPAGLAAKGAGGAGQGAGGAAARAAGRPAGGSVTAAAAAGGAPAAPHFASRKPAAGRPPAAAGRKPAAAPRKPAAGAVAAATAAAGGAGAPLQAAEAVPKAPALGKRAPEAAGTGTAAAKPPAAKRPKAAAAGGAGKAKAGASSKPAATADGGAAGAAAAGAAPKRAKAKPSDLDLAQVAAKVAAARAASGGASLKGVSVAEMTCYLRAHGAKGGSVKRADVEARLLAMLAQQDGNAGKA